MTAWRPTANDVARSLPATAVFVLFAFTEGGFWPMVWLPAALFLLAALALQAFVDPAFPQVRTPSGIAIACFGAFVLWSYASIAWADVSATAWEGANRSLLYLLVFVAFAAVPWTTGGASLVYGTFALAVGLAGLVAVEVTARSERPEDGFIDGLLIEPTGYHNSAVAFFVLGFWPALAVAARRDLPPLLRGLFLGCAGILLGLAVIPQSRGSLVAFPVSLAVFFAIVPYRVRMLVFALPVFAAVLVARDRLLGVYSAARDGEAASGLFVARNALLVVGLLLFLTGIAIGVADRRVTLPRRVARIGGASLAVAVAAACLVTAVAVVPEDPARWARDAWAEFKSGEQPAEGEAASHFTSNLGSNRYDFWRVGLREFRAAPVAGTGADNFGVAYVRDRRSDEEPLYSHSLEIQTLAGTGLVGTALLGAFLAAALFGAFSALRRRGQADAVAPMLAAAGIAAVSYWFVHASGDWMWEVPGVTAPALGFLGLAAGLASPARPAAGRRAQRRPVALVAAAVAVVAAVALLLPWLAAKEIQAASQSWRSDPGAASAHLDRARRLNPLSDHADLVAGAIASRRREWPRMRVSFERALERNPHGWYAELELGVVEAVSGNRTAALAHLDRAHALNPLEPAVAYVRSRVEAGRRVDPDDVDSLFADRVEERTR